LTKRRKICIIGIYLLRREESMSVESRTKAQAKYDKDHTTGVYLKLNNVNDADILEWLSRQHSKQGAVKELIRQEIKRENGYSK
jgi:hypothetical protein